MTDFRIHRITIFEKQIDSFYDFCKYGMFAKQLRFLENFHKDLSIKFAIRHILKYLGVHKPKWMIWILSQRFSNYRVRTAGPLLEQPPRSAPKNSCGFAR